MGKVVAWLWHGETQQVSFPALCALLRSSKAAVPFRAHIGEERGVAGQLGEHSPHPQEIEALPPLLCRTWEQTAFPPPITPDS